jgi:hypothetical protein
VPSLPLKCASVLWTTNPKGYPQPLDMGALRISFGPSLPLTGTSESAWVRPEVVVEVTYLTWTEDNLLRQVSYQGQREDKPARQVVRPIPHPFRRPLALRDAPDEAVLEQRTSTPPRRWAWCTSSFAKMIRDQISGCFI